MLLPGADALLAPEWVPWSERLRPGDLGVGDLLPTAPDDDRLVPGLPAVRRPGGRGGRARARPRPGPGAVPRSAATRPPSAGTPATPARHRRWPAPPRPSAAPAASTCRSPARCGPRSASAATSSRPPTAGSSRPTTAAARTPTWSRRAGRRAESPVGRARRRRRGRHGARRLASGRPVRHRGAARRGPRRVGGVAGPVPRGRQRRGGPARSAATATGWSSSWRRTPPTPRAAGVPGRLRLTLGRRRRAARAPTPARRWTRPASSAGHAAGVGQARRRGRVGRFGVGFAAVLAVTDEPAIARRPAGCAFSAARTAAAVAGAAGPGRRAGRRDGHVPVLRLPWPADETSRRPPTASTPRSGCRCAPASTRSALLSRRRRSTPNCCWPCPAARSSRSATARGARPTPTSGAVELAAPTAARRAGCWPGASGALARRRRVERPASRSARGRTGR